MREVVEDIKVCLDHNNNSEALIATADIDTLTLEQIVRSKVVEAVETVHKGAPAAMLEEGHLLDDAVYWGDQCSGYVLLPADFMRLVVFEMSDWERPVFEPVRVSSAEYAKQRQRVKALRGTAQRPVCAIVNRQEGKALEFYSCKSEDAYMSRGTYMPYPAVDQDDGIDISERCYGAVIYQAAALVLITLGEAEKSAVLSQIAQQKITET